MPTWDVTGADPRTGEEKVYRIDATTAASAEHKAGVGGLLVSGVTPVDTLDALAAVAAAAPAASAVPHVPAYRTAQADDAGAPSYSGIVLASVTLRVFAALTGVAGVVLLVFAGYAALTQPPSPFSPSGFAMISSVVSSGVVLLVAVFLYAAAQALMALRDIARNSFRS